jgi:N-methylhydantoinase B
VTKEGGDLEIDLTESHPEVKGFINSSYANTYSAAVVALAYLIDPEIPKNDGAFRPLRLKLKEGTLVWPRPGAPVTLCTNHCGQEIIEAIIRALASACPERVMAGWGRRFRMAVQGIDPRSNAPFIWHLFQARPGGGGSAAGDGWPGAGEWQAAGGIKFGSIEVQEVRFPLHFRRHEFRRDSGGDGRHRGGPGGELELVIETSEPAVGNTAGDGIKYGACGLLGGRDGRPHRYWLQSANRPDRMLKTKETGIVLTPGDVLHAHSGGGGGWGRPEQRTAEERARDIELGFVSAERS